MTRFPTPEALVSWARLTPAVRQSGPRKGRGKKGHGNTYGKRIAFYGVVIYMYWSERDHPVAHFHAYHAGRRVSVSAAGEMLAGSLEPRALQFVREWAVLRQEEIMVNWERARRNEPLLGIEPLA